MKRQGGSKKTSYNRPGGRGPVHLVMEELNADTWVPEDWTKDSTDEQPEEAFAPAGAEQISFEDILGNAFERAGATNSGEAGKNIEFGKG